MLIIGAKGFAKEVLEVRHQNNELENLCFYDDVNDAISGTLYGKFPILKTALEAKAYFENTDSRFTIGIGDPNLRATLYKKFTDLGGDFTTVIAENASIGHYGNQIGPGCNIMQKCVLTNDVTLGKGVLINQLSSIGHDVQLGDFVEICPSVSISGNCVIGEHTFIGTGAIVLPKVKIGSNVIIGAGSVVTKDIPDNVTAVGIPAKVLTISK